MEFIGKIYQSITQMHQRAISECDEVWAAVAYVTNQQIRQNNFIKSCFESKKPLTLYARYDETIPVGLEVLQWFLDQKSPDYLCFLVRDILHSKIIWYRPVGIYIGSANLTTSAWLNNIEAGVFIPQVDMEQNGLLSEIEDYFALIKEHSHPLRVEIYDSLSRFCEKYPVDTERRKNFDKECTEIARTDFIGTPKTRKNAQERAQKKFIKEWNETLQILRNIASIVSSEYRPKWVQKEVPQGVQADQFLHAYYYGIVRDEGKASRHKEMHKENKVNRTNVQTSIMKWWSELPDNIHEESKHMHLWAPKLRQYFSKSKLLTLSDDEFIEAMPMVHAFSDYARKADILRRGYTIDQRCKILAKEVLKEKNNLGENILDLLDYVLWGGPNAKIAERIYQACYDKTRKIPHIGLSTIGEIVGWALPNDFPPRNGRTSKALYALGYDVKLYTE